MHNLHYVYSEGLVKVPLFIQTVFGLLGGIGAHPDEVLHTKPSADRLFHSVAKLGIRCVGVVLTGMGDDGVEGARAIRDAGGIVIAESQETAIVNGMPGSVVRAGVASEVLPLPAIGEYLAQL